MNGLDHVDRIRTCLGKNSLSLPETARYLGLACGEGIGELTFALKLGIDRSRITLLDKKFSDATLRMMDAVPEVGLIQAGVFAFLNEPQQKDFSVVSAFGVDYLLDGPRRIGAFITALPKILHPDAFVCISPYRGKGIGNVWEDNGFTPLARDNYTATMHFHQ